MCPDFGDMWGNFPLLVRHVSWIWGHVGRYPLQVCHVSGIYGHVERFSPCWRPMCPEFGDIWRVFPMLVCHVSGV